MRQKPFELHSFAGKCGYINSNIELACVIRATSIENPLITTWNVCSGSISMLRLTFHAASKWEKFEIWLLNQEIESGYKSINNNFNDFLILSSFCWTMNIHCWVGGILATITINRNPWIIQNYVFLWLLRISLTDQVAIKFFYLRLELGIDSRYLWFTWPINCN